MHKVFVKIENGLVTAVNSSAFISGDGWVHIDSGDSDKYHHAQNNYLPKSLMTQGVYQYKLVDGIIVERTLAEMQADIELIPPPPPTDKEVIDDLLSLLIANGVITNV